MPVLTIPLSFNFLSLRLLSMLCKGIFKMENICLNSYKGLTFEILVGKELCKLTMLVDF